MPIQTPGISITDVLISSSSSSSSSKPRSILMVCTRSAAGTTADNVAALVADTSELTTKIGTVPTLALESYKRLRALAPTAQIYVLPGKDPATTPTVLQNLVAGINSIVKNTILPFSVTVCPEAADLTTQADRTAAYTSLEAAMGATGWDFVAFVNTAKATDTKAKADTEIALYSSPQGNMVGYYGWEKSPLNESVELPICVAAAGLQIALLESEVGFRAPAGNVAQIGNIDPKYVPTLSESEAIMTAKTYNFVWSMGGKNYIWNDCTLATDEGWDFINTRLGVSYVQSLTSEALAGIQFNPADPNPDSDGFGAASRELQGRLTQAAEKAKGEGAITAYTLSISPVSSGKSKATLQVRPIQSQRWVEVQVINNPRLT